MNPPLDLFEAARKIDRMANIGKRFSADKKNKLEAYAVGTGETAMKNDITDPAYFANWDKRLQLDDQQIKYLIGKNMNDAVGDAIYVIDIVKNKGVFIHSTHSIARLQKRQKVKTLNEMQTEGCKAEDRTARVFLCVSAFFQ